jgi:hypothetical protein
LIWLDVPRDDKCHLGYKNKIPEKTINKIIVCYALINLTQFRLSLGRPTNEVLGFLIKGS